MVAQIQEVMMPTEGSQPTGRPFLTGAWRNLAMLNYEVDPGVLAPYVPRGTELDFHEGKTYVSVVGFQFLDTKLLGLPIPWHRNFEEVNLRLYVRRHAGNELRRGVVFIKELVRRWWIAKIANWVYNENYEVRPMRHAVQVSAGSSPGVKACYEWRIGSRWNRVRVEARGASQDLQAGSHPEFITEHFWGYCGQRGGGTIEYRVAHPRWRVWDQVTWEYDCDAESLYGPVFAKILSGQPASVFLADGSDIQVYRPVRLPSLFSRQGGST